MFNGFSLDKWYATAFMINDDMHDIEKEFKIPRLPWAWKRFDKLMSVDGKEYLLQNKSRSIKYIGSDGELGKFAASYSKDDNLYLYRPECDLDIERELGDAFESACGEVLGSFHVPRALEGAIKIAARTLQSKALKAWIREGLMENAELNIAADADGGVKFCLVINGDYPTRYGGIERMTVCELTGKLQTGVVLSIPANQLIEMPRLGQFIRSDATIRVTRAKENQKQAVMTWSSAAWDGSVMTRATIKSL